MQVNKSLKLLKKINSVFHSLIEGSESVSALEQELLKSYVIQFYDTLIASEQNTPTNAQPHISNIASSFSPSSFASPQAQEQRILTASEEPQVKAPTHDVLTADNSGSSKKNEAVVKTASVVEQPTPQTEVQAVSEPSILADLMVDIAEKHTNSHIGERMISDLKKAMGLNDKLRYAKDLFGGNQSRLLETLEKINASSDMETVVDHLNDTAKEFDWLQADRNDSAANFLSLVYRKFKSS